MKNLQKIFQVLLTTTLLLGITTTTFAEISDRNAHTFPEVPSTPPATTTTPTTESTSISTEAWKAMSNEERFNHCSEVGITGDSKCRAIYNETSECFYQNPQDRIYDVIRQDCKVEGNSELCMKDRAEKIKQCLEEKPKAGNTYCEEQFVCRSGPTALSRTSESGIPYDSEYFNVNDRTSGLVAPNQSSFNTNANANGGPIIGTVNRVINLLVSLIGIFALLVFIVGAIFLITANGDDNKIQKGKGAIKFALIGLVFVMLSYTIVILIQSILF